MAWESRKGSSAKYYTRSYCVGGRIRRVYIGRGPMAELASTMDCLRRIENEIKRGSATATR